MTILFKQEVKVDIANIGLIVVIGYGFDKCLPAFRVLPQSAILEHGTLNLYKSLIVALSFNFARHRQVRQ